MDQQPGRRVRYPGLLILLFVAFIVVGLGVQMFIDRNGTRETECGGFDCVTNINGPVPQGAFLVLGLILAVLLIVITAVIRSGRRHRNDA